MPRDKKTGIVTPPTDQSFLGGISIEMNTYALTVPTGRKTARFQSGEELAAWYNQNKYRKPRRKNGKKKKGKGSKAGQNQTFKPKRDGRNNQRMGKDANPRRNPQ